MTGIKKYKKEIKPIIPVSLNVNKNISIMGAKYKIDEVDKQILEYLIDNTRMPFTEIAKKMLVSAGTIHVRVKKMEDAGLITGSHLDINYDALGYKFVAYVGILLTKSSKTQSVVDKLYLIPNVIQASVISGKYNIFSNN